jgi:hypothetical protein
MRDVSFTLFCPVFYHILFSRLFPRGCTSYYYEDELCVFFKY